MRLHIAGMTIRSPRTAEALDRLTAAGITDDAYRRIIASVTLPAGEVPWDATICVEGIQSGDERIIAENALTWDTLPLPFTDNHDEDRMLGRMDAIVRNGFTLLGAGVFADCEEGREAAVEVALGMRRGMSVDLDDVQGEIVIEVARGPEGEPIDPAMPEPAEVIIPIGGDLFRVTRGRIRGVALCTFAAFVECQIALRENEDNLGTPETDGIVEQPVAMAASAEVTAEAERILTSLRTTELDARGWPLRAEERVVVGDPPEVVAGANYGATMTLTAPAPTGTAQFVVNGSTDAPLATRERSWSADDAAKRLRRECSSDGSGDADSMDWAAYGKGFFWHAPNPSMFSDFKLGFCDVVAGTVTAIPRGIFACAAVLQGARGGVDIPQDEQDGIKNRINGWYAKMRDAFDDPSLTPPWESSVETVTAAAIELPDCPPAEWFADPLLTAPTRLTITDEGRVFGHIAQWGTCHIGRGDACITPPSSPTDYSFFRTGTTMTTDGQVATGPITVGIGHAALSARHLSAVAHYDDTRNGVADLNIGEDAYGIWVAGAVRSSASPTQVREFMAAAPSGDWRRIDGALELVAILAVNTPGFPVTGIKALAASLLPEVLVEDGECLALVAAGAAPLYAEPPVLSFEDAVTARLDTLTDAIADLSRVVNPLRGDAAQKLLASIRDTTLT